MTPYGCHNRAPFEDTLVVQDGRSMMRDGFGQPCPVPVFKDIPFRGRRECVYTTSDLGKVDARCNGCRWAAGLLQAPAPAAEGAPC